MKIWSKKGVILLMAAALAGLLWAGSAAANGLYTLEVTAGIDGSDYLYIQGSNVWWEHRNYTAVGYHGGIGGSETNPQPTYLKTADMDVAWTPVWPSGHDFGDVSDPYPSLIKGLAAVKQDVVLESVIWRGPVTIVQQPDAGNSYILKVLFNDDSYLGSTWYTVKLQYIPTTAPLPGSALLLGSGFLGLVCRRFFRQSYSDSQR